MRYPTYERQGWKVYKSSFSKRNTELAIKENKKRGLETKVIRGKRRLKGGNYTERILLVREKKDTSNLDRFNERYKKAKKTGISFSARGIDVSDPQIRKRIGQTKVKKRQNQFYLPDSYYQKQMRKMTPPKKKSTTIHTLNIDFNELRKKYKS